jgi:hypothetical protein
MHIGEMEIRIDPATKKNPGQSNAPGVRYRLLPQLVGTSVRAAGDIGG